MKYFLMGALLLAANGSAFAGKAPCTAPGVPHKSCVCFSDGQCIDISDPGVHP
ncbi:MAG: hypothetical protein WCD24_24205 [Serratia inhibens]|uniref:hypothetical protein n=1 Tax=Serratia inhibens TaxID=2338073 RepID=UPI003C7B984F